MPALHDLFLSAFALLSLLAVAWSFSGERRPLGAWSGNRVRPWVLLLMAVIALFVGCYAMWDHSNGAPVNSDRSTAQVDSAHVGGPTLPPIAEDRPRSFREKLLTSSYLAAQQILLNAPAEMSPGLAVQVARVAALAAFLLLAYEAVSRLFAASFLRLWLRSRSDHVVICGLGRTGFQLVRHFRDRSAVRDRGDKLRAVIVVESHADHDRIEAARALGAVVQKGDATDAALLQSLGVAQASILCFVTGSDEANVDGACLAAKLIADTTRSRRANVRNRQILAHLRSGDLGTPLEDFVSSQCRQLATEAPPVGVFAFNVLQQAAMEIVTDRLLRVRPKRQDQALHAVIFGCSPIAQTLALHLAEYAHFENLRRTRLTMVCGSHDGSTARQFRADYPRLFPQTGCDDAWHPNPALDDWAWGVSVADRTNPRNTDRGVEFVVNGGMAFFDGAPSSPRSIGHLVEIATRGDTVPCVFICGESDEHNCAIAFEMREELDGRLERKKHRPGEGPQVHIFVYVPHRPSYAKLSPREGLVFFGNTEATCSFEAITWAPQRRLAELIAATFHRTYGKGECPPFHQRELWDRRSNLSAAGHVHAKLATLDLKIVRAGSAANPMPPAPFSEPHRLVIAQMEHNRWMAERLLHGWSFGENDLPYRRRKTLVDWENLSDDERAKDVAQAIELPNQCTAAEGFELMRM